MDYLRGAKSQVKIGVQGLQSTSHESFHEGLSLKISTGSETELQRRLKCIKYIKYGILQV